MAFPNRSTSERPSIDNLNGGHRLVAGSPNTVSRTAYTGDDRQDSCGPATRRRHNSRRSDHFRGPYHKFSSSLPAHTVLALTGGAIGQGMPNAVGAAIACPERPVINLQGDGSAMYTVQALWTQAHERLNVTTLICSNRSYDILKLEMSRGGYMPLGPSARTLTDLAEPSVDWVKLSESMGMPGVSVANAEDLARELGNALNEAGPHLIEMKLTP